MTEQDGDHGFFFARKDAAYYDATVDLAAPYYRVMHEVLMDLVALRAAEIGPSRRLEVLDVGSGSGVTTVAILERFANARVVALDFSREMNALLQGKLEACFGEESAARDRWEILELDVLDPGVDVQRLRRHAGPSSDGFAIIVTALTLHHFLASQKASVYRLLHGALAPGGIFINADFFAMDSDLSSHADQVTRRWIERGFDSPAPDSSASALDAETRGRLKVEWIDHLAREHHLDSMQAQITMLELVGFRSTECPFRYWQSGVLWTRKTEEAAPPHHHLEGAAREDGSLGRLRREDGSFALQTWRELINEVARDLGPDVQAICPFGFETSSDPSYLWRNLRRFHVYLGIPPSSRRPRDRVAADFADALLLRLHQRHPAFGRRIHGIVMPHRKIAVTMSPGDVIYVRARLCEGQLLDAWASYLLLAAFAVLDGTLREIRDFETSDASRGYAFQLAIIMHGIFGSIAPLAEAEAQELEHLARRDPPVIEARADGTGSCSQSTERERAAFRRVVRPLLQAVAGRLGRPVDANDELVLTTLEDFHDARPLQAHISRRLRQETIERITRAYRSYPHGSPTIALGEPRAGNTLPPVG